MELDKIDDKDILLKEALEAELKGDINVAISKYEKAYKLGEKSAAEKLAWIYFRNILTAKLKGEEDLSSLNKAILWYKTIYDANSQKALTGMMSLILFFKGTGNNCNEAREFIVNKAKANNTTAKAYINILKEMI